MATSAVNWMPTSRMNWRTDRGVTSVADLDRELKYLLPEGRAAFAERWLAALCRADSRHPASDVWTVYYDTPAQVSLREKVNSDYLKAKVRVRWYAPAGGSAAGDAFVEMKRRIGDRRDKVRLVLPSAAPDLTRRDLDDPIWGHLLQTLLAEGVRPGPAWRPVLTLVYRRTRFVDVASGARVNCDSGIRATAMARPPGATLRRAPLPVGVIEVKGPALELPRNLRAITRFGGRLASFSKYVAVWEHARLRPA